VIEETNLPFASKVRTTYLGQDVGVMHACGHDIHTAVQLGVATVLTAMKASVPGTRQSQEALIANGIPQTVKVDRRTQRRALNRISSGLTCAGGPRIAQKDYHRRARIRPPKC